MLILYLRSMYSEGILGNYEFERIKESNVVYIGAKL